MSAGSPDCLDLEDRANFRARLGDVEFLKLVEAFGGWRIYVPRVAKPSHQLAKAIGIEGAAKLGDEIGGCTWRVPLGRDFRILYYLSNGVRRSEIGRRLGMTETGLQRSLKRLFPASGPPEGALRGGLETTED